MLVELDGSMICSLIKGCDPDYHIMDHPLIKTKGCYCGGHNDRWVWNSHFVGSEEELWETYQLLRNPSKVVSKTKSYTQNTMLDKLCAISGVEYVNIVDHNYLSVSITVIGGDDADIAQVLSDGLPVCVGTLGNYEIFKTWPGHVQAFKIYRKEH